MKLKKRDKQSMDQSMKEKLRYWEIKYPGRFFAGLIVIILFLFLFVNHTLFYDDSELARVTSDERTDYSFMFNILIAFTLAEGWLYLKVKRGQPWFAGWRFN